MNGANTQVAGHFELHAKTGINTREYANRPFFHDQIHPNSYRSDRGFTSFWPATGTWTLIYSPSRQSQTIASSCRLRLRPHIDARYDAFRFIRKLEVSRPLKTKYRSDEVRRNLLA